MGMDIWQSMTDVKIREGSRQGKVECVYCRSFSTIQHRAGASQHSEPALLMRQVFEG